jgi:hypothetical protein
VLGKANLTVSAMPIFRPGFALTSMCRNSADSKELGAGQPWEACASHRTSQAGSSLVKSAEAKLYVVSTYIDLTDWQ